MFPKDLNYLVESLFEIGSIKFGQFTLKSGLVSPIYFDLRLLISHPKLMKLAGDLINDMIKSKNIDYDVICGVPYAAIPLATCLSITADKPMILKRKEAKSYGTKSLIEGTYSVNDRCLIIEDVVTYGDSILETAQTLTNYNLQISDIIVLLDRNQGAKENIESHGIRCHCLVDANYALNLLFQKGKINEEIFNRTMTFLSTNSCAKDPSLKINQNLVIQHESKIKEFDFETRAKMSKNQLTKNLFEIIASKKTNLSIAADITDIDDLLQIAEELGPHICMLKTHVDIINNFNLSKIKQLYEIASKHRFLIFEDRKFADIGNTVQLQYTAGAYKISQWSHIVNAHSISGPGVVQGLKEATAENGHQRGCLLVAEMSSKDNLINSTYVKETLQMAEKNSDFVIGFICQSRISTDPTFVNIIPGVQVNEGGDNLGQQYMTPEKAIYNNKCDIVIVGRGILKQSDRVQAAINYKNLAYNAYLRRLVAENNN